MKTENIIKALEKKGWSVHHAVKTGCLKNGGEPSYTHFYHCDNGTRRCSWWWSTINDLDGYVDSVRVRGAHEEDEIETDYVAGVFCHTIKSVVACMGV